MILNNKYKNDTEHYKKILNAKYENDTENNTENQIKK